MSQASPTSRNIVAIILVTIRGELILQQRDRSRLGTAHLRGKIGFFGGHGEPGETPDITVRREILEELELELDPAALEAIGTFRKQQTVHGDNNSVIVFRYTAPVDPALLVVHEGAGYVLVGRNEALPPGLTPFARQLTEYQFAINKAIEAYRTAETNTWDSSDLLK